ncbi:IS3 family transposase [endosymbiont of Acanthamoeba sp. UWC8]|uniref:IS3 family transposase n=1 Tax=endosymbiont of Acanthamoeba sp. UWC8 TaxID=86106 RepID=UPI00130EB6AC|nr:IS3 family transposase [endosymbiont of Acanthamoeba sp. UWC8]
MEHRKELIEPGHGNLSVARQCKLLTLNRSTYYYKKQGLKGEDYKIMKRIDEIFTQHPYYGARRMAQVLKDEGYEVGRKKISKYYRLMALEAIYPKMNLSKRNQAHKVYPYLLSGLEINRHNQVWSADITYVRLKQGFVYLVAIIDWYSRYILSWRVSISLESEFCVDALNDALARNGKPEIFNTDQGVQFTSKAFIETLEKSKIAISMDSKGRALDNIFIERFWRSLKQEKIYRIELNTVKETKEAINEYMNFYNKHRLHQSLGYKTPKNVHFTTVKTNLVEEKSGFTSMPLQDQELNLIDNNFKELYTSI